MKNIIIGGTGFIGSALTEILLSQGEDVCLVARELPINKIDGVEYFDIDLEKSSDQLSSILGKGNSIFILIGQMCPGFDLKKEEKIFGAVLDAIGEASAEKVIFASSVLVYGDCQVPAREDQKVSPSDDYSAFKVLCEQMIREKLSEIPVGIVRISNVYGSEKNKGFIGLVFRKILERSGIKVNGNGLQERDYIFVDDVVSAMIAVRNGLQGCDIVNIATGESVTLIDLIRLAEDASWCKIPYEVTGVPVDEVETSRIDVSKLKTQYAFEAKTSLKDGLKKTWNRYQQTL